MIGKVIAINEGKVKIKLNIEEDKQTDLINNHIIFESKNNILVGEILTVENSISEVLLVGEFLDGRFLPGAIKKPEFYCFFSVIKV